ncbi:unnamed protein product [Ranitomeya imitator]|uniref:Receptor ligand binding region domain-containing protein n=1 Tax=Ranitomeya imitator TaxID=111125 RepID=A0ABN9KNT1_9NEOB|nr:unnamed protein product [Ranitomeya imitator]
MAAGCLIKMATPTDKRLNSADRAIFLQAAQWIRQLDMRTPLRHQRRSGGETALSPRPYDNLQRESFLGRLSYLIFLFAIENINKSPDILPNITLGYHLYDSCSDGRLAARHVLHFLSGPGEIIPNYSCTGRGQLVGIVGDQHSPSTIAAAQILGLYGYPQTLGTIDDTFRYLCPIDLYWYRISVSAISDIFRISADTIRYRYFQISDGIAKYD